MATPKSDSSVEAADPGGRPWRAEVETIVVDAARRIALHFPARAGRPVETFAAGWDNTAFLVDRVWVFRFPRKAFAVAFLDTEIRVLPWLAPHLPWPITTPTWALDTGAPAPLPAARATIERLSRA